MEAYQDDQFMNISQKDIIPGDVLVLKSGMAYCDMVVLWHTNFGVDESALAGESAHMSKSAIESEDRNTVYCMWKGTQEAHDKCQNHHLGEQQ